jgi:hypothetical protein
MASLQSEQDARVAKSVVYLVASVLLILAFSVISLFLEAELNNQQSLQGASEPVAIEQVSQSPVASAKRRSWWFNGRHDEAGPGSVEPGDQLG